MFTIISPSKTQSTETRSFSTYSLPTFQQKAQNLVDKLKLYSIEELAELMQMSEKLAVENHQRFRDLRFPFTLETAGQAIFVFQGDVYGSIRANEYTEEELFFCQDHLAILSGLYGLIRPLDLMMPYRLEMGLKFTIEEGTLYDYWRQETTECLNSLSEGMEIINLASNEYFKVLDQKQLKSEIIVPAFKERTEKGLKTVAIYAKQARGKMVDFIIRNKLTRSEQLLDFVEDGYSYSAEHSKRNEIVFIRDKA